MDNNIEKIRHSLSHLLAMAVLEVYPDAKLGIGPTIENGFYYDFDLGSTKSQDPNSKQISNSKTEAPKLDLIDIEKAMRKLINKGVEFKREEINAKEAEKLFATQPFKLELIKELAEKGEKISIYKTGRGTGNEEREFVDLCAGPHVENTKEIGADAFKLTKIAGAYWKGSEKNPMLTRVYGTAFATKEELDAYLKALAEAEKNDHRVLAEKLDLFMISEDVGKGLPLWLPNGAFIRKKLEDYMYEKELARGYKYVYTPVLTRKKLYETSGHLSHYREDMYNPIDIEGEDYYLKPMNCPHHHMIYGHKPISYRDMPLRLAEFGLVHRFERSGVLTGLIRARCFTQNDSHIYCRRDQLENELLNVLELFKEVYNDFKIEGYWFRLSLPDFENNKEKYGNAENKEMWEESAEVARNALKKIGVKYIESIGEATFYGPKIDIQIKNIAGKEDTIATAQVDFYSAEKFGLEFTNEKGEKEKPVIIHRAIMGSFDRFFAFLTEKVGGNFPVWLSPIQATIVPVSEKVNDYGEEIFKQLKEAGIRVELNKDNSTLGKKIRATEQQKIPYILVVGEKEVESKTLAVRSRGGAAKGEPKNQETLSTENFILKIKTEIAEKK